MTSKVCGKRVLPPGYRFEPHDHELIKFYLLPKVNGSNVYPGVIHDMDVYCCQPSDLALGLEEGSKYSYFFTSRVRKFDKGSRADRCTKDGRGYWRMTSMNEILDEIDESILGRKNTLVYFHKTKQEKGAGRKTNWIMHEFVIDDSLLPPSSEDNKANGIVICRIHDHGGNKKQRKDDQRKGRDVVSTLEPSSIRNEMEAIQLPVCVSDQSSHYLPTFSEESSYNDTGNEIAFISEQTIHVSNWTCSYLPIFSEESSYNGTQNEIAFISGQPSHVPDQNSNYLPTLNQESFFYNGFISEQPVHVSDHSSNYLPTFIEDQSCNDNENETALTSEQPIIHLPDQSGNYLPTFSEESSYNGAKNEIALISEQPIHVSDQSSNMPEFTEEEILWLESILQIDNNMDMSHDDDEVQCAEASKEPGESPKMTMITPHDQELVPGKSANGGEQLQMYNLEFEWEDNNGYMGVAEDFMLPGRDSLLFAA